MRARECEDGVCAEGRGLWQCREVSDFRMLLYDVLTRAEAKFFLEI